MKICFIAEGSYPYMIGGISSWLNIFLKCFPEYEFITFAIGASEKDRGKYSCKILDNMTSIEEIFLDTPIKRRVSPFPARFVKSDRQMEVLINHFSGNHSYWPEIFEFTERIKKNNLIDFFNSTDFYEIVQITYNLNYSNAPYNDFLWTIRTMFIYQFYVLIKEIPDADIYHCVSAGFPGIVAAKARYFKGKPFVLTEHGIYTREREEEIIKSCQIKDYVKELWVSYFRSMSQCAYSFADKIITQFERNREVQISLGADSRKTAIIPNGMDIEDEDLDEFRLYGENVVVGAIARVVPIKDIITMLRAYKKAKKTLPDIKLVIMGPTNEDRGYFTYVQNYVEKEEITDVTFTGKVDFKTYKQSLSSMDIVLLTSISEGQPLSLLEAMSYGKPVIATDVGSCGELIKGRFDGIGDAGIIVPVVDTESIADSIVQLSSNEPLRAKMGKAGQQRVREFYSLSNLREGYRNIYEDLIGRIKWPE